MQLSIHIRLFREDDAPALSDVFFAAVRELASADYSPEQIEVWAPHEYDEARWAARMRKLQPFVAEAGGIIVGYADVQADGYIDHFFVSPTVARQGVGMALMRRLHDRATERAVAKLHAHVSVTARPFFAKCGFVVVEPRTEVVRGVELPTFHMRKSLDDERRERSALDYLERR